MEEDSRHLTTFMWQQRRGPQAAHAGDYTDNSNYRARGLTNSLCISRRCLHAYRKWTCLLRTPLVHTI